MTVMGSSKDYTTEKKISELEKMQEKLRKLKCKEKDEAIKRIMRQLQKVKHMDNGVHKKETKQIFQPITMENWPKSMTL